MAQWNGGGGGSGNGSGSGGGSGTCPINATAPSTSGALQAGASCPTCCPAPLASPMPGTNDPCPNLGKPDAPGPGTALCGVADGNYGSLSPFSHTYHFNLDTVPPGAKIVGVRPLYQLQPTGTISDDFCPASGSSWSWNNNGIAYLASLGRGETAAVTYVATFPIAGAVSLQSVLVDYVPATWN